MADTERMEAVKRAYAEIILNTAAESAARILASERKAMGFQRSLAMAKQEAVDMMLRLKSLMDSKINEAETRNMLHARRIQELESQLEKADSVILSLRAELEREREANNNNNKNNKKPSQQAGPTSIAEEEENTSSYYKNVVSTDNSSCSVKDVLGTGTGIGTDQGSKVRSRNRWTQRVRALDQSKDPKGGQVFRKNGKNKKSRENGGGGKDLLRRDPPRRSRTKSNYVKISKFGMKIDGEVSQNGNNNKVLHKFIKKEKETGSDSGFLGAGLDPEEAPIGLELIADNIGKEDDQAAIEEPTPELAEVDPKPNSEELETPVVDSKAEHTVITSVTEPEGGLRSIKYTFRRKRKRGFPAVLPALLEENKDENSMCNKDANGNNEENKERRNSSSEAAENRVQRDEGAVSDSRRSNRRLAQVARQLISLSTKKW